jgi:FkbM family methyltransferase
MGRWGLFAYEVEARFRFARGLEHSSVYYSISSLGAYAFQRSGRVLANLHPVRIRLPKSFRWRFDHGFGRQCWVFQCIFAAEPTPYGARVTAIHAGAWSRSTKLSIRDIPYRDGREWTRQVQEDSEGEIDAIDITSLLKLSHHTSIGLLKIDIEGAEVIVFRDNCSLWFNRVEQIAIELHDDSIFGNGTDAFYGAVKKQEFNFSRSGELTICTRRSEISQTGSANPDHKRGVEKRE